MSGGYLKYLRQLVPLLQTDPRIERLQLLTPRNAEIPHLEGLETIAWSAGDGPIAYRQLQARLREFAPDVVFIPTARWLDCGQIPTVVMVRNMEPLTVPFAGNALLEGLKNLARAHAARLACRRATRVIAVSGYVRDFLVQRWGLSTMKIGVVYHGTEPPPVPEAMVKPQALDGRDVTRFIFAAGSIRPARGLEDVIRAMTVAGALDPTLMLVIAGRPDSGTEFYRRQLQRLAGELRIADRIVWVGHLKPLEMAWCFDQCRAFVTTSRAEACPNTALEAMSHGCQVVSSRQAPMPEFFGAPARYYEPRNSADLAEQISSALAATSEDQRARRETSRARARGFEWPDTAQKTIAQLLLATERPLRRVSAWPS